MKLSKSIIIIGYSGWCGIGFIRGQKSYKYEINKPKNTENFLYSHSILYGLVGIFIFANPLFIPIMAYKELYRFEVDIRNLEDEKKSSFYNKIL
jgi:hypothetical protein